METKSTLKYVIVAIVIAVIGVLGFKLLMTEESVATPDDIVVHEGWLVEETKDGRTFMYPEELGLTYVRTQEWPPVIGTSSESFACTPDGVETRELGITEPITVSGHEYCATRMTEGAAGSSYTTHTYARASGDATEIMTFTTKSVQCGNYDELEMNECVAEQATFDVDKLADEVFQTLR
jgi:hypothetical protein